MHKEKKTKLRVLTYSEAIREAIDQSLEKDENLIVIGEGVPDPKSIFGTTSELKTKYGDNRIFDMPLSENGFTGFSIGAALNGIKVLVIHQRIDFSILSLDQIINNAAKWHYMFNGQKSVGIVIRLIVGRGWGQGPQHSQNLQALFAHIPGLKVIAPATPADAKGMMISSINDPNPVIFIENRWLHHIEDHVPENYYETSLSQSNIVKEGKDLTIVTSSLALIESIKASQELEKYNVSIEIIDLRSIKPIDYVLIGESIKKTGKLLVVDHACRFCGVSAEIISTISETYFEFLDTPPARLTFADHPIPTSSYISDFCYPDALEISLEITKILKKNVYDNNIRKNFYNDMPKDVPDRSFNGPF